MHQKGKGTYYKKHDFHPVSVVNEDGVFVEFCGVKYSLDESRVEVWLWVKNQSSELIAVYLKDVIVNRRLLYRYYFLNEYAVSDCGDTEMIIRHDDLKDICQYQGLESIEFTVEIGDIEDKSLFWSPKMRLLCDVKNELFKVSNYNTKRG